VVDGRADRPRETVVALEVRYRAAGADVLLRERVELPGADAGCDVVAQQIERLAGHDARLAHDRDLLGSLDLDPPIEQPHVSTLRAGYGGAPRRSRRRKQAPL